MKILLSSLFFTLGLSLSQAHSQLIAYDGFDYTQGTTLTNGTTGLNGGTGWNSTYFRDYSAGNKRYTTSNIASVGSNFFSSQTASPFMTTGNSFEGDTASDRGYREWAALNTANAFDIAATGAADQIYFSFLTNKGDNSNSGFSLGILGNNSNTALATLNVGEGGFLRIRNDAYISLASSFSISANTNYFVILKLSTGLNTRGVRFQAVTYSNANNVPTTEAGITWTLDTTYTYAADHSLNAIAANTTLGSGGSPVYADEFRIGNNYSSIAVVPEPSTMALLLGGAGALLGLRRRRRLTMQ